MSRGCGIPHHLLGCDCLDLSPAEAAVDDAAEQVRDAAPELLASLKETRDCAVAIMRILVDLELASTVKPHLDQKYFGFGNRADAAIDKAEGRPTRAIKTYSQCIERFIDAGKPE